MKIYIEIILLKILKQQFANVSVGIDEDTLSSIIGQLNGDYSLKNIEGFFQWIKIMGLTNKISNTKWLTNLFNLTKEEIYSVLENENVFLITQYKEYNSDIVKDFDCENKTQCGIDS